MEIIIKEFKQLSTEELHNILQLRSEVFVVEQDCVYQDIDGKDLKAIHIFGKKNKKIVAYSRIFKSGDYFDMASIGRVVVSETERTHGYGHQIMKVSVEAIQNLFKENKIKISAQKYLINFYETHGFKVHGDEYLEDGIPHVKMQKN